MTSERRTHPGTWDRVLGDLAPGTVVTVNPDEQTGRMIHDFLQVEPKQRGADRLHGSAKAPLQGDERRS